MSRVLRVCVSCVLLLAGTAPISQAQVGEATALFLQMHPQPRVHSLGKATVALRGYSGAIDVNPATIGEQGRVRVGTNVGVGTGPLFASTWHPNRFSDVWISSGTVSARSGEWAGGIHWKQLYLGEIEVRNEEGVSQGTFESFEREATVAGAFDVTDHLTVGAGARYIQLQLSPRGPEKIEGASVTTAALDLGLHYWRMLEGTFLFARPSVGWSLRNFGPNVDLDTDNPGDRALPMMMRLGGGLQVATLMAWRERPFVRVGLYGALSNRLANVRTVSKDGETYVEADGPFRTLFSSGWTAARGVQGPGGEVNRLSVGEQTIKHAGLELSLLDLFSVRWGRFREHELNGNRQYTAYGFGLDLYYIEIERSWTAGDGRLDNAFWRLTGRIPLDRGDPRNFWPDLLDSL